MAEENPTNQGGGHSRRARQTRKQQGQCAEGCGRFALGARGYLSLPPANIAEKYRGGAAWDDAQDRVRTFQEDGEQYIRDNPTKAVFTALGIGFILGLIFRR